MEKIRKDVLNIMEELERLSSKDYRTFELALALFLRSDRFTLKYYITDSELEEIDNAIYNSDSFMSEDLKDFIDNILSDDE